MRWFNEGNAYFQDMRYDDAIDCWEKALAIGEKEGIDQVVAKSLMNIGTAYSVKGDQNKAIKYFYRSLEIERQQGDDNAVVECLLNIGDSFFELENWESARLYYKEGLEMYPAKDRTKARVLLHLGLALFSEGNWNEALIIFQDSVELFRELNDLEGLSKSLANLGIVTRNMGRWEAAIDYYQQSLEIDKQLNDQKGQATSLMNIGIALEVLGKIKEAIEHYQQSLTIFKQIGDKNAIAICLLNLGNAFEMLKKWENSLKFYRESIKIFEELGDKSNISKCLTNIGVSLRNLGKWEEAIKNYHKSLEWFESVNDQASLSKCLLDLGVAYFSVGKWDEAVKYYEQSKKLFKLLGDRPGEALACQNLGWGYKKYNNRQQALKYFTEALGIYTTLFARISSNEYRESYAKEFEQLPRIIESLTEIFEKPIEIKEYTLEENHVEKENEMSVLLSQLRNNITQLNTAVQTQSDHSDISTNISRLMNLINKTYMTFSQTEKLKGEKLSRALLNSIESINDLIFSYENCVEGIEADKFLELLTKAQTNLSKYLPELDLISDIQEEMNQIKKEASQTIVKNTSLTLRFKILTWIKRLYSITSVNNKLYLQSLEKPDSISQQLEQELNRISQRIYREEINYAAQVLGYLIITRKRSGVPIYQWNFIEATFDSDLVGGFLSAIQSFGSEITKESTSMEKLAYRNFEINFQDGEYIRCALILKGELTELLAKRLRNFVTEFESQFMRDLTRDTGNIGIFETTDKLIEKHFDLTR